MLLRARITTTALALAAAAIVSAGAQAAPRSRAGNEITVTKRSYLDAGTAVAPGTLSGALNYVQAGQWISQPDYENISTQFGSETLPRRWELPNFPSRRYQGP